MAVPAVTNENFQKEVVDHKGLVFVDFHAEWCGPCKLTSPIVEQLSDEIKDIKFVAMDVDANAETASKFSVFSIPTFVMLKEGKEVGRFVGAMGKEGFLREIERAKSS